MQCYFSSLWKVSCNINIVIRFRLWSYRFWHNEEAKLNISIKQSHKKKINGSVPVPLKHKIQTKLLKYLCLLYQTSFIFIHTDTFCELFIYTLKELGNEYSFPEKQCMNIHLIPSSCVQGLRRPLLILFPFGAYRALTLLPYSVVLTGQFSCFYNPITVPFPAVIPSVLKVMAVYSSKTLILLISHWYQLTR